MLNVARHLPLALVALVTIATPALADDGPITHTDQLIVVTPNPPIMISNGAAGPGASPAAALAPTPVIAGTAAPQNERWEDVSHINGSPVKVGERGDYLYKVRKTNISSNPIGWMLGIYGVSVSHAVSSNIAVRADANFISLDGDSGYELGVGLPIYFRRVYSGPFIEPGIITRGTSSEGYCDAYNSSGTYSSCMSTESWTGPSMMIGWHWTFDSGLNLALAGGAMRPINNDRGDDYYDDDGVQPAGYFRVGYAF